MAKQQRAKAKGRPRDRRLFTVDVVIIGGPVTGEFVEKNKVVSRTIQIRGDQTLQELHDAIFDAFDRFEEHLYEFRVGAKKPRDRNATVYEVRRPTTSILDLFDDKPAGYVDKTTIGSIGLKAGDVFFYRFDFGDDWWHRIKVLSIEESAPASGLPRVTHQKGDSPPQYPDLEDEDQDFEEESE